MLVKAGDLIGKKVLTLEKGENIEDINEIIYDSINNKVAGFVVDNKGWFKDAKVILFESVKSFGEDRIIVQSKDVIVPAKEIEKDIAGIARGKTYLNKNKVITQEGKDLGEISDLYFDSNTGEVTQFEVTQGALKNLQGGKKRVQYSDIVTIGKEAIIVKSYTEEDFQEQTQTQGATGMLNQVKDKASEFAQSASDKIDQASNVLDQKINSPETKQKVENVKQQMREAGQDVSRKLNEVRREVENPQNQQNLQNKVEQTKQDISQKGSDVKRQAKESLDEARDKIDFERRKDVTGKYLTKDVFSPNDEIIGRKGEEITNEMLDKAASAHVEDQIYNNAQL